MAEADPAVRANPPWAELVQIVPVVVVASSFLAQGEVDLARAGPLFAVAALLTIPSLALPVWRGHLPNPIAVGTDAWLWIGAAVFGSGWAAGTEALAEARGTALFACALAACLGFAALSPTGCVGARGEPGWIRRTSAQIVVFAVAALLWSWMWRANLRIGSGVPFLALNLVRRAAIARAR